MVYKLLILLAKGEKIQVPFSEISELNIFLQNNKICLNRKNFLTNQENSIILADDGYLDYILAIPQVKKYVQERYFDEFEFMEKKNFSKSQTQTLLNITKEIPQKNKKVWNDIIDILYEENSFDFSDNLHLVLTEEAENRNFDVNIIINNNNKKANGQLNQKNLLALDKYLGQKLNGSPCFCEQIREHGFDIQIKNLEKHVSFNELVRNYSSSIRKNEQAQK